MFSKFNIVEVITDGLKLLRGKHKFFPFVLFYFLHSASTVYCYITPFPLINETTFFQEITIEQRGGEVVPQPPPTTSSSHPALSQDPYLQHVQP